MTTDWDEYYRIQKKNFMKFLLKCSIHSGHCSKCGQWTERICQSERKTIQCSKTVH
jgi:hypothetical protein